MIYQKTAGGGVCLTSGSQAFNAAFATGLSKTRPQSLRASALCAAVALKPICGASTGAL